MIKWLIIPLLLIFIALPVSASYDSLEIFSEDIGYDILSDAYTLETEANKSIYIDSIDFYEQVNLTDDISIYLPRKDVLNLKKRFYNMKFHTTKGKDFEKWCTIIDIIEQQKHLTSSGFLKITKIRDSMNYRPHKPNKRNHKFFEREFQQRGLT